MFFFYNAGDHNSNRPKYCMDTISIFLYQSLCVRVGLTTEELTNRRREKGMLSIPPSVHPRRHSKAESMLSGESEEMDTELQRVLLLSMQDGNGGQNGGENGGGNEEEIEKMFIHTYMKEITLLVGMGFEPEVVVPILKQTNGNVERATQMLCEMSSSGGGGGGGGGSVKQLNDDKQGVVSGLLNVPKNTVPDRAKLNIFQEETSTSVETNEVTLDENVEVGIEE